jgi:site-specific recombinase XerD
MKRLANPALSQSAEFALRQYKQVLREQEDLTPASVRNYLSDVRQFIAWYETQAEAAERHDPTFTPQSIATPTLMRYRTHLQTVQRHKPASVNRSLISLKRYFDWVKQNKLIVYDPSVTVKLVGQKGAEAGEYSYGEKCMCRQPYGPATSVHSSRTASPSPLA